MAEIVGTALRSNHLMGGECWSDMGTLHLLTADNVTLCGVRVGNRSRGWFTNCESVNLEDWRAWGGYFTDADPCDRCRKSARKLTA